jgi:DNA-binding CsgD family transcriptional regulator
MSTTALVERASVAAIATDPGNVAVACNDHVGELLGKSPGEVIGRNLQDVLEARDIFGNALDPVHGAFHDMVRRFDALQSFKMDVLGPSGRHRRVATSIVVVLGSEADSYHLVYLMTPIHRRRRADQLVDQLLAGMGVGSNGAYVGEEARGSADAYRLTGRQTAVLRLLAEGKKAADISDELCVSVSTVRSHIQNILRTLDVSSQLEAVAKALALRLI